MTPIRRGLYTPGSFRSSRWKLDPCGGQTAASSQAKSGARLSPKLPPPRAHLFVTRVFDAGALPFNGGVGSPQEPQRCLRLAPLPPGQQEARRLGHEAHQDHEQRGGDGAADGQPAPAHEKTCGVHASQSSSQKCFKHHDTDGIGSRSAFLIPSLHPQVLQLETLSPVTPNYC